jgi:hypothetical protein
MRIGRALIIPAALTLAVAGLSLAGTAGPAAAVHTSNIHVLAQGSASTVSGVYYHT